MINYYLITKPGIILGNLITVAAGFWLASKGEIHIWLFLATLLGLALIIASACVFNNYIDKQIDGKMERTKNRPLVRGLISPRHAICFAALLGLAGNAVLIYYTNALTVFIADIGFFVYVLLYSLWKGRTIYGTAIGSIAGAMPPLVGYCAVSNTLDGGAVILFALMVLWQMPHFYAIALYRLDDYKAAGIPALPIIKGALRTKVHMALYIAGFIVAVAMLTFFNYAGYIYLSVAVILGSLWLALSLQGFTSKNDALWGKQMFRLSLVVITLICFTLPFDLVSVP